MMASAADQQAPPLPGVPAITYSPYYTHRRAKIEAAALFSSTMLQQLSPAYEGSLQRVIILAGSPFLRPAQQLLGDISAALLPEGPSASSPSLVDHDVLGASKDLALEDHRWPEFREKNAQLLYMQEEVCKMYNQHCRQIQTVVSSFESVPGLSCATPYASLVLKAVSKRFQRLTRRIQCMSRLLEEEEYMSRGDHRKQKSKQPVVWMPRRGHCHSERAVSVLRAWLFDNFLHPYPSDEDKQMLATRTGLSRNQVSNWFTNARVRLWKPMVEELHIRSFSSPAAGSGNSNCTSFVG